MQRRRDEDDKGKTFSEDKPTPKKRRTRKKNLTTINSAPDDVHEENQSLSQKRSKQKELSRQERSVRRQNMLMLENSLASLIEDQKLTSKITELYGLNLLAAVNQYKALEAFIATLEPDSEAYHCYQHKKISIEQKLSTIMGTFKVIETILEPYNDNETKYLPGTGDILSQQTATAARKNLTAIRTTMQEAAKAMHPIENISNSSMLINQNLTLFAQQPKPLVLPSIAELLKYQPK